MLISDSVFSEGKRNEGATLEMLGRMETSSEEGERRR